MITSIRNATNEEWDYFVDSVESTLYFQTREWFEIWADYAGFESDTKLVCFDSGKKVLLPLARMKLLSGLVKAHFLAPKGMGGFVTEYLLAENERNELFEILNKIPMLYASVNPYETLTNEFPCLNGEEYTQFLDLSQGFAAIFKNWSKGHSSATKKGIREGVRIEPATTKDDWRSYYEFYLDNMARWGNNTTNNYSWRLFELLCEKKSGKIILWLAKYQGKPVSGALCFYHNRHVAYWHSASSQQFFRKLSASHVLQYHIIKDACDRGFLLYDLMPSGGIEGVIAFKKGFSPLQKPVRIYMSPSMRLSSVLKNRFRNSKAFKLITKNTGF